MVDTDSPATALGASLLTTNTHFTIGVHVLTALSLHDELVTSSRLASSVSTNPAFLRAVMGRLREAGLIETKLGAGGGSRLARDASEIQLLDVYRATEGEAKLCTHACSEGECPVSGELVAVFDELSSRLDRAVSVELGGLSIADLRDRIASSMAS